MREYVITAVIVLVILGLGFGILIEFGVAEVTYFGLLIISFALVGAPVYTWWKTKIDKTTERTKSEILVKMRNDHRTTLQSINNASDIADMTRVLEEAKQLQDDLVRLPFFSKDLEIVGRGVRKNTLTSIEQENRRVEQKLRSLEGLAAGKYKPELDRYIASLRTNLGNLKGAGYKIDKEIEDFNAVSAESATALREMIEKKKKLEGMFSIILDKCIEEVTALARLGEEHGSVKRAEERIFEAKENKADRERCISYLIDAIKELKNVVGYAFHAQHSRLVVSLKGILELLGSKHVKQEDREHIQGLLSRAKSSDDPARLGEINDIERESIGAITRMLLELQERLTILEREVGMYNLPEEMWTPEREAAKLIESVRDINEFESFTKEAGKALEYLIRRLDEDDTIIRTIKSYDKVEPIISEILAKKGYVVAKDVKLKHPETFLAVYNLKHDDTEYNEITQMLKAKK